MSIEHQTLNFKLDGVNHINYLSSPQNSDKKHPAVIVIHEWWGLDAHAKERADTLAQQGYVALALDMYGEGKTVTTPEEAFTLSSGLINDFPLAKQQFLEALKILKQRPNVNSSKIIAIGYCFGGTMVLNMARAGLDLALVSSFHGALSPPLITASSDTFKSKVLVFNGEADPYVSKEDIESFKKEMSDLKADYSFTNYKDAIHSFTNKKADENGKKFNLPLAYNKQADEDSWSKLLKGINQL